MTKAINKPGRPMTGRKLQVSLLLRPEVWARVCQMAEEAGIARNVAVERALIDMVNVGKIPGIERLELDAAGYSNEPMLPRGEIVGPARQPHKMPSPSREGNESKLAD